MRKNNKIKNNNNQKWTQIEFRQKNNDQKRHIRNTFKVDTCQNYDTYMNNEGTNKDQQVGKSVNNTMNRTKNVKQNSHKQWDTYISSSNITKYNKKGKRKEEKSHTLQEDRTDRLEDHHEDRHTKLKQNKDKKPVGNSYTSISMETQDTTKEMIHMREKDHKITLQDERNGQKGGTSKVIKGKNNNEYNKVSKKEKMEQNSESFQMG